MTDMTNDPMQDPTVLASAYLDGEVTPDERARVESSPELMAEVDQLRHVRSILIDDTAPAALSVRESQLAAALDVYDQLGPSPTAAAGTASLAAGRARRSRRNSGKSGDRSRLLLGAAAGLVIVAGAGAVIRGVIVGTTADDDVAEQSADEPAEEPADESLELGPAASDVLTEVEGGNTGDELRTEIDPGEVATDIDAEDLATASADAAEEPAEEPAEEAAQESDAAEDDDAMEEEPTADDAGGDTDSVSTADDAPPETDLVVLVTPQDLADLAAPAAYATNAAELDPTEVPCAAERPDGLGIDRLAEPALVTGETVRVGADLDAGLALAFRDDCTIVLDALLPTEEEYLAGASDTTTTSVSP